VSLLVLLFIRALIPLQSKTIYCTRIILSEKSRLNYRVVKEKPVNLVVKGF